MKIKDTNITKFVLLNILNAQWWNIL